MKKALISLLLSGVMIGTLASCSVEVNTTATTDESSVSVTDDLILGQKTESAEKYTLYLGLNDKDTFKQKFSTEDSLKKANQICAKYAGGYTQLSANGGWTNDDGTMGHENTLVYIIYDITEDKLQGMLDELLKKFNQSSILVEKELESHIYYSGK